MRILQVRNPKSRCGDFYNKRVMYESASCAYFFYFFFDFFCIRGITDTKSMLLCIHKRTGTQFPGEITNL